jgi:hypothetical protein
VTGARAHRAGGAGLVVLAVLALLTIVAVPATPAAADAARPTDYRSTIVDVSPALPPGVAVRIVGGDSFLELSVPRGHTAEVRDYAASDDAEPAPYLRFRADGTVERNERAVATTANESRYGTSTRTPDPGAEPRWTRVASDGTYAWHDHRIHWMSPSKPVVGPDGRVDLGGPDGTWSVPITVDGTPTVVTGELTVEPAPAPLAWAALTAVIAALVVGLGVRWGLRASAGAAAAAGVGAVVAAWATWQAVPPAAGGSAVPVVVAGVGLLAAVVAVAAPARWRLLTCAAAAAALVGWAVTRWTVLTRAVLPTTVPYSVDRAATATALGAGLGLAVVLLWRPAADRGPSTGPPPPESTLRATPTA